MMHVLPMIANMLEIIDAPASMCCKRHDLCVNVIGGFPSTISLIGRVIPLFEIDWESIEGLQRCAAATMPCTIVRVSARKSGR